MSQKKDQRESSSKKVGFRSNEKTMQFIVRNSTQKLVTFSGHKSNENYNQTQPFPLQYKNPFANDLKPNEAGAAVE